MPAGVDMVPEVSCHRLTIARDYDAPFCSAHWSMSGSSMPSGRSGESPTRKKPDRQGTWFCVVSLDCVPEWTAQVFIEHESARRDHGADSGAIALRLFLSSERLSRSGVVARCRLISAWHAAT